MIASIPQKKSLTPVVRQNFTNLSNGFRFLKRTRWIYILVIGCISLGSIVQKIFLGPFYGWFTTSSQLDYADIPIGLLILGILIISIPRIVGNINFIIQLKRTAKNMNDGHIISASRFQIARVVLYSINMLLIIILAAHLLTTLDSYYIEHRIVADTNMVFEDLTQYNRLIGIDVSIIAIIGFYGLFSLGEKLVNYLTWKEFSSWSQKQLKYNNELKKSKIVQDISFGGSLMRYGIFIMCVESIVGNIVFNIGLQKMEYGFANYPSSEIYVTAISQSRFSSFYSDQKTTLLASKERRFPPRYPLPIAPETTASDTPIYSSQDNQGTSNYCAYCGNKHRFNDAAFCTNCGTKI